MRKRNLDLLYLLGFLLFNLTLQPWSLSPSAPTLFFVAAIEETSATENIKHMISEKLQPITEKYKELPPKGRFGVSSAAGFVTTKLTVRSTVKAAKVTGAAFIM